MTVRFQVWRDENAALLRLHPGEPLAHTLYGVTRDLLRRVHQHREGLIPGFTRRYRVTRLVYFEETSEARSAFARERQIKGWSRLKKVQLVELVNSGWVDLAEPWLSG